MKLSPCTIGNRTFQRLPFTSPVTPENAMYAGVLSPLYLSHKRGVVLKPPTGLLNPLLKGLTQPKSCCCLPAEKHSQGWKTVY
jgi:hypothetical protein